MGGMSFKTWDRYCPRNWFAVPIFYFGDRESAIQSINQIKFISKSPMAVSVVTLLQDGLASVQRVCGAKTSLKNRCVLVCVCVCMCVYVCVHVYM